VFFAMTNNSSVLLYLFRAQISSNLLGIIYKIISARNQDIIMVYEAVIKVDIYGVVLANKEELKAHNTYFEHS
jgi:hypothetical protein